jgi:hypothetical protein
VLSRNELVNPKQTLPGPLPLRQHKTPRFKAGSLIQKEVAVNLLRQFLNVSGANTHLGKYQARQNQPQRVSRRP